MWFSSMHKEAGTKAKNLEDLEMVEANFSIKMVAIMMVCGNKIKCKDLVDFSINLTS